MFAQCSAETGIIGAPSAIVPFVELHNLLVVRLDLLRIYGIDLVLHYDYVLHADDLKRHEVLARLGLGAVLCGRDDQHRTIHEG
jgi:hypothetical protein